MGPLRGMKMSLFVILMLLFTAATAEKIVSFIVREGDEVALPCGNVTRNRQKCDPTYWVTGRVKKSQLNVTADCSLVIKSVTRQDAGRYSCRQIISGEQEPDALMFLSVIHISSDDALSFYCYVYTNGECAHTVQWQYKGGDGNITTKERHCVATARFTNRIDQRSALYNLLYCNVTDERSGQTLLCDAISKSCRKAESTTGRDDASTKQGWLRYIIVFVGLAAFIITVVTVNIWMKSKGNQTQTDHSAVQNDEDEDEGLVVYEDPGGYNASVRIQKMSDYHHLKTEKT
ncbi:uncharacterized protein LOC121520973 isoform X1 [Cheilinus undulatus]|uniref:uncharacterized protein LOC121520973 isoform X1 n=1 Tax=Cheilinus undulatus TaxID=241271 RepID=UPI001BD491BA|nr:uncharacterized protein LOC121520973 isoform X1 [Cheilinus undulatus]